MLVTGSKLLICHRQLFAEDWPRLFVGEVSAYEEGVARVTGYSFTKDPDTGLFERKDDPRTKLISISSGSYIVYELPSDLEVEAIEILERTDDRTVMTDHRGFEMDLSVRA